MVTAIGLDGTLSLRAVAGGVDPCPSPRTSPATAACTVTWVAHRNSTRFTICSALKTSAISIAPPMSAPIAALDGTNRIPA